MIISAKKIFLFLICLPAFISAAETQNLIKENFGEHFYGVYIGEFKLGYVIHKISQTQDEISQNFSMNVRISLSEEEQKEHKAKYAFSQIISQYQFNKETGLLNSMTEADGKKYYADYDALLNNNYFKLKNSKYLIHYHQHQYLINLNHKEYY